MAPLDDLKYFKLPNDLWEGGIQYFSPSLATNKAKFKPQTGPTWVLNQVIEYRTTISSNSTILLRHIADYALWHPVIRAWSKLYVSLPVNIATVIDINQKLNGQGFYILSSYCLHIIFLKGPFVILECFLVLHFQ